MTDSQINCVYIDFSKAVNDVSHQLQQLKFTAVNIDQSVLLLIQ